MSFCIFVKILFAYMIFSKELKESERLKRVQNTGSLCFILKERLNALAIRFNTKANVLFLGFPDGSVVKNLIPSQCRVRKIPSWRKWQPTPVSLPERSHGQRSLAGHSPWGLKELDMTENTQCSVLNDNIQCLHTNPPCLNVRYFAYVYLTVRLCRSFCHLT